VSTAVPHRVGQQVPLHTSGTEYPVSTAGRAYTVVPYVPCTPHRMCVALQRRCGTAHSPYSVVYKRNTGEGVSRYTGRALAQHVWCSVPGQWAAQYSVIPASSWEERYRYMCVPTSNMCRSTRACVPARVPRCRGSANLRVDVCGNYFRGDTQISGVPPITQGKV